MNWDYIIVGAGSAGCAAAHELAKFNSDKTVLVLEAGGSDRSHHIKIPASLRGAMQKFDWGYQSQPDPTRHGASENWKRGRVLGGSSSINGMVYVRGAVEDFDHWDRICGHTGGWSAREVMPLFCEMENSDQDSALRGHGGPLHVTTVRHAHSMSQRFLESAVAAGHRFNPDYNGRSQEGVSYLQRTLRKGLRWSAADAFLKPLLRRKNLTLLLNATVEKIEVANGRAVAVSFVHEGRRRRETARDIVLCAGAINTPKLLMLSGIGDAEELRRHGIDTVLDVPAVGRHLQEHPLIRLVYRSKVATYNLTGGLPQKIGILAKFLRFREGPVSVVYESTAFVRSVPEQPAPDLQMFFAPIGVLGRMGTPAQLASYPGVMVCVMGSYPASSGCVRLASGNPEDPPSIECRLLQEQSDVDVLVRAIGEVRKIMRTRPIADALVEEVEPGLKFENEEALQAYVRRETSVTFHPIGTCRMGMAADTVVSPDLRVRGLENLWIADASIMPHHLSANINAACIMIGKKLGKQLAARAA